MKKLLVILLVLGMVAPAMAAEWNLYGSARVKFFYYNEDSDASNVQNSLGAFESDTDLNMGLQGNARIGANVKASDVVSGRFEYGTSNGNANIRLLYGTWNFGPGSLEVGQNYTPIDTLYSNQVVEDDNGLLYEGMAYEGRKAQLKLKFGGFQVAFVQPSANGLDSGTDVVIPKIELAYDLKMDMISVGGFGGYQTYSDTVGPGLDYDVNAWVIGGRGKFNFGPAYANFCVWYAQNASDYGLVVRQGWFTKALATAGTPVSGIQVFDQNNTEDAKTFAGAVAVGAKFSDMVGIEGGIGYIKTKVDDPTPGSADSLENASITYYLQVPITLAPGVFIVPEITVFDYGDVDITGIPSIKQGKLTTYGAKFQINF